MGGKAVKWNPPPPSSPTPPLRLRRVRQYVVAERGEEARIWRLLDANANRVREGLRVLEDTMRFVLSQPNATRSLRSLRHSLDLLIRDHYSQLLAARKVEEDSGRFNVAKPYKGGVKELLAANFKRCAEAMRVLEEYGRIMSESAPRKIQNLRFQVYTIEKRFCGKKGG